jgi:hypothetical protein
VKEEILLLKIQNALKEGKDYYEATSGNWKINENRFPYIKLVAGVSKGKIVCLFEQIKWVFIKKGTERGRKRFEGKEASLDTLNNLQNAEEKVLKKFGSGSAVAYISLSEID